MLIEVGKKILWQAGQCIDTRRSAFLRGGIKKIKIKFASKEHQEFYHDMLVRCKNSDTYHQAFFYCIGISDITRVNVERVFNFKEDCIEPEGLHEGWQTGGTVRLTRLAFNLWNGYVEKGQERMYTPYELFDCGYAPYFLEAIKMKYPDYCR